MKAKLSAVFLIATILLLIFATKANGESTVNQLADQESKSTLPKFLPVADLQTAVDWNFTNDLTFKSILVCLVWTNIIDQTEDYDLEAFDISAPISIQSLQNMIITNGMESYRYICKKKSTYIDPDSNIELEIHVLTAHEKSFSSEFSRTLLCKANLGPFNKISESSFSSAIPICKFVEVDISVPNLEIFKIEADTAPPQSWDESGIHSMEVSSTPYSYMWSNGISTYSRNIAHSDYNHSWPWYEEYTTDNMIVINDWCIGATNRIRYTIVANGQIGVYTQHGDLVCPAKLTVSPNRLDLSLSRGTDVIIESSSDLKTWTVFKKIPWSDGVQKTSFTVNTTLPHQYFRTKSW
ncbi:MAG: hypothetical protein WC666_04080 [Candidatus Paceibacterota bacterium]|jgi:hypothetical protein